MIIILPLAIIIADCDCEKKIHRNRVFLSFRELKNMDWGLFSVA